MVVNADGTITRDERPGAGTTGRGGGGVVPGPPAGAPTQPGDTPTGGDNARGELPPLPPATSEMGMIIQMMLDQGRMQRATPESLARGVGIAPRTPPGSGIGDTGTGAPGGPAVTPGTQTEGGTTPADPAAPPEGWVKVNGRWVNPGVVTPAMPDAEFASMMQDLMRVNFQIGEDSPLYTRRNEIMREIRRRDPNASFENTTIGAGGEGGDSGGVRGVRLNFDPSAIGRAPVNAEATPALRSLLSSGLYNAGGGGDLMSEMYNAWDGEEMLRQIQAFDPTAHWEDTPYSGTSGGGEGGLSNVGRRLVYDRSKLPISEAEKHGWDLAPVNDDTRMFKPEMTYYDPVYGRVTDKRNIKQGPAQWWEVAAPLAISLLAPWAAPAAAAAMGLGAAGAGATSLATGTAAGLAAANIPGAAAAGAAAAAQLPWYLQKPLTSAPQIGRTAAGMLDDPRYRIGAPDPNRAPTVPTNRPAGTTAPPPAVTTTSADTAVRPVDTTTPATGATPTQGGTTTRTAGIGKSADTPYTPTAYGAPLARNQVLGDPYGAPVQQGVVTPKVSRYADTYGFDPSAFNAGGSPTKPTTNDTKRVATQFADDPYRFS